MHEELSKAKKRMKKFDNEEAIKQIETPRIILNFDYCKSVFKSEIKTFDQDVMKIISLFKFRLTKRSISNSMHQDSLNKMGSDSWKKEFHGTRDQKMLINDDTNTKLILVRFFVV